ncbi:MAG: hypothetical protein WC337_01400 [Candidatus Muiribacteriota bacterium]
MQEKKIQKFLYKTVLFLIVTTCFFTLSGCFGGASPGLKVLKITGEQYFNDAKRYLRESQFIFDNSKINSVHNNIDKNQPSEGASLRGETDKMLIYLKILREYSSIKRNSRKPDIKNLNIIDRELHKKVGADYNFLKVFYLYVKSFSNIEKNSADVINVFSLKSYFNGLTEYEFPYFFGGEKIDVNMINYFCDMTILQHGYFADVNIFENNDESIKAENLIFSELLRKGEAYYRAGLYDESEKYLKYFRLPTFSEFGLKDYALVLLSDAYKKLERRGDSESANLKNEMNLRFIPENHFYFMTDEQKKLFSIILKKLDDRETVEDMLDLISTPNKYLLNDFSDVEKKQLISFYNAEYGKDIEFNGKKTLLYDFLEANSYLKTNKVLLYFYNNYIELLFDGKLTGFFLKSGDSVLKPLADNKFEFRMNDFKAKTVYFTIEYSPEDGGLKEEKIILTFEE